MQAHGQLGPPDLQGSGQVRLTKTGPRRGTWRPIPDQRIDPFPINRRPVSEREQHDHRSDRPQGHCYRFHRRHWPRQRKDWRAPAPPSSSMAAPTAPSRRPCDKFGKSCPCRRYRLCRRHGDGRRWRGGDRQRLTLTSSSTTSGPPISASITASTLPPFPTRIGWAYSSSTS